MRDDVVADSGEQDKISRFTVLGYVVESLTRMKSAFSGVVGNFKFLSTYF